MADVNEIKKCSKKFSNGVTVVNTTPHPINFLDGDEVVEVASSPDLVVNATAKEERVNDLLVQTKFVGNAEGQAIIDSIIAVFPADFEVGTLAIIGSLPAANAYAEVVGMTPAPGFERVPPAEKRMNPRKFNAGDIYHDAWKK